MKTVEVEGDESCSGANETNDVEEVGESDEKGIAGEEDDTSNSESESDEPSSLAATVSPGDHVVAVYVDNQRPYIGKAIDVDGSDVHITFMAPYMRVTSTFAGPNWKTKSGLTAMKSYASSPNQTQTRGALHLLRYQEKVHWNYILRGNDFNI